MKALKISRPEAPEDRTELARTVGALLEDVKTRKDQALFEASRRFDGSTRTALRVSPEELAQGLRETDPELREALEEAAANLRRFARRQREALRDLKEEENAPGVFLGHRVIPVDSCGCYVPGGGYPLISTALMLAIPALAAGVPRVCACTPVMKGTDRVHPAVLAALSLAGVTEVYALGGAQAVGALAYGTESVPPVDLVVGPGNRYVTEAKRQCVGRVGIDFVAGPSEVLVLADAGADPSVVAADLLAQAEHDPDARSALVSLDEDLAVRVEEEVRRQLETLPTAPVARASWEAGGEIWLADSPEEAQEFANLRAPEHLELNVRDPEAWIPALRNYGSLFVGEGAAEVFGDYVSGTNHTLPTMGAARYTGGLWVGTFLKVCTFQRLTPSGAAALSPLAARIARAEGLFAHAAAAEARAR